MRRRKKKKKLSNANSKHVPVLKSPLAHAEHTASEEGVHGTSKNSPGPQVAVQAPQADAPVPGIQEMSTKFKQRSRVDIHIYKGLQGVGVMKTCFEESWLTS